MHLLPAQREHPHQVRQARLVEVAAIAVEIIGQARHGGAATARLRPRGHCGDRLAYLCVIRRAMAAAEHAEGDQE
jgi:hypothetical protein